MNYYNIGSVRVRITLQQADHYSLQAREKVGPAEVEFHLFKLFLVHLTATAVRKILYKIRYYRVPP